MNFLYVSFFLLVLNEVSGRATQSSESESVSSSRSSSSEEMTYNEKSELEEINEKVFNSSIEDTETLGKTDLEKFDKGLELDAKDYVTKRVDNHMNSTERLDDEDLVVLEHFKKTGDSQEEELHQKNETVLGIDTFGAQGI
ncbi:unnamed protein product [Caenorhabditis sp. 36 PRJEB53466]|nr:unnamed protein product [Caenorhabditis sp. 36 PRJEB53466]